jgi:hypothetical protein
MIPIETSLVMSEVARERSRQNEKWGEQNHPDGTGPDIDASRVTRTAGLATKAVDARRACQEAARRGDVTWYLILREEYFEAMAEDDPAALRAELIQTAAVCIAWVEAIDRRNHNRRDTA